MKKGHRKRGFKYLNPPPTTPLRYCRQKDFRLPRKTQLDRRNGCALPFFPRRARETRAHRVQHEGSIDWRTGTNGLVGRLRLSSASGDGIFTNKCDGLFAFRCRFRGKMPRIAPVHNVTITSTRGCTNARARKTTDEPWRPANRCVRKTKTQGWGKTVMCYCTRRYVPCSVYALRTSGIEWRRRQRQRQSSQVQGRAERPVSSATYARGLAQSRSLLSVLDRKTDQLLCRILFKSALLDRDRSIRTKT